MLFETLPVISGQAEAIPDEFRGGDEIGVLPSWITAHKTGSNFYPKHGSWPRGKESFFHVPFDGLPEFEAAIHVLPRSTRSIMASGTGRIVGWDQTVALDARGRGNTVQLDRDGGTMDRVLPAFSPGPKR